MTELSKSVALNIRRRWLVQAMLSAPLLSIWSRRSAATEVAEALRGVFSRPESARAVGRAVLHSRSAPSAAQDLVAELDRHRPELCRACGVVPRDRLVAMLGDARRNDFEHGHTLIVDGWLLGRTEALVCALVAVA